jgi:hypothetical protein
MPMALLPLDSLGAIETNGTVTFGILLPWVSAAASSGISQTIGLVLSSRHADTVKKFLEQHQSNRAYVFA